MRLGDYFMNTLTKEEAEYLNGERKQCEECTVKRVEKEKNARRSVRRRKSMSTKTS